MTRRLSLTLAAITPLLAVSAVHAAGRPEQVSGARQASLTFAGRPLGALILLGTTDTGRAVSTGPALIPNRSHGEIGGGLLHSDPGPPFDGLVLRRAEPGRPTDDQHPEPRPQAGGIWPVLTTRGPEGAFPLTELPRGRHDVILVGGGRTAASLGPRDATQEAMREQGTTPEVDAAARELAEAEPWQTFAVGVSMRRVAPSGGDLSGSVGVGPLVRLGRASGWGLTGGLGWYRSSLAMSHPGVVSRADLLIRPVVGGPAYAVRGDRLSISGALLAGISFNGLSQDDGALLGAGRIVTAPSFAVRPSVSLWYELEKRLSLGLAVDYLFTRPDVTFAFRNGLPTTRRVNADAASVSVSVAYWIF